MHLIRTQTQSLDASGAAVDLGQSPAEIVFLSFTDSDLAAFAQAWDASPGDRPSLRLACLAALKHPYSVDLYVDGVARHARFVLVRLLGGLDYWRYGVEELARAARRDGFDLAVVPGDHRADDRLDAASTVPADDLRRLWGWFHEGGPANMAAAQNWLAARLGRTRAWAEPTSLPACTVVESLSRPGQGPRALLTLYRSVLMAADTAPLAALADALAERGMAVTTVAVTSLKDPSATSPLAALIDRERPAIIVNTTAFSGRGDGEAGVLDRADVPVIQAILASSGEAGWRGDGRGLSATDLAMHVVLPELDGRVIGGIASCKAETLRQDALEYIRLEHRPLPDEVALIADRAAAWVRLATTPRAERRIACVLSDYPDKGGRSGYAVGLDTPASVARIAAGLRDAGYTIADLPEPAALMRALVAGPITPCLSLADYRARLAALPAPLQEAVRQHWGEPEDDVDCRGGWFGWRVERSGHLIVALQPERGRGASRKGDYHDTSLPPRHGYVAFYLWLRAVEAIHALIHGGTHGTLEWLPGKAVGLTAACAPAVLIRDVPVIYPFIVSNPGEAAQAKRRIAAVTVSHLTPPLVAAGQHGAAAEIEALFDEYAAAQDMDPARARTLATAILERAEETGLAAEAALPASADAEARLASLDGWLCDLKEMRIGDGLHVFGRTLPPEGAMALAADLAQAGAEPEVARAAVDGCADAEWDTLLAALDGRFVQPGPGGAPTRGRLDVLPTGRNLYTVDPRAIPTRTAWEIGKRHAQALIDRYLQDEGDWPRRILVDLWGSATMRTGGDDLAQALALIGVRPVWDHGSTRVSGIEVLPCAVLGRPRIDVTLRMSGLFRDVFPGAVALFDQAVRAVAALDEDDDENPLASARRAAHETAPRRVFGPAPGQYGLGLSQRLATGDWTSAAELGADYLAGSRFAYGAEGATATALEDFRDRVASTDAFVHTRDLPGQDVLDADGYATHVGGFMAAAQAAGATPRSYITDATAVDRTVVRSTREEVARVLRGRAINPRWLAGQMRHGHRGAAEIAETVDNVHAWAALAGIVSTPQFDLLFDAVCADDAVRRFLRAANPEAAAAIAGKLSDARARGLWRSRRNAVEPLLAELAGEVLEAAP